MLFLQTFTVIFFCIMNLSKRFTHLLIREEPPGTLYKVAPATSLLSAVCLVLPQAFPCLSVCPPHTPWSVRSLRTGLVFLAAVSQQGVGAVVCAVIGPTTSHSPLPRLRGDPARLSVLAGGAGGNRASQNDFCCRISDEVEVLFLVWFRG